MKKAQIGRQLENKHSLTLECNRLRRDLALEKEISLYLARGVNNLTAERDMLKEQSARWVELQDQSVTLVNEANTIIKQLMEEKLKFQIKFRCQQDEAIEALRERLLEAKAAMGAYEDRDRCLEAMKGMKEHMRRGTVVIEAISKENEDLRAQLGTYISAFAKSGAE